MELTVSPLQGTIIRQHLMTTLTMAGLTDPGRLRPQNEDRIVLHPEIGLVVLADGMGGHNAGEVASRLAVDVMVRHCVNALAAEPDSVVGHDPEPCGHERDALHGAIEAANIAIHEMAHHDPECAGMGSTVVAALFQDDALCVAHVGDSRLYRLRDGRLQLLTEDHSVVQELLNRGLLTPEQARQSVSKNLVTRALGVDARVQIDMSAHTTEPGDLYLLCSDGLNDVLTNTQIEQLLTAHGADPDAAVRRLVDAVNQAGGPDNISVILVRTDKHFRRTRKTAQKLLKKLGDA